MLRLDVGVEGSHRRVGVAEALAPDLGVNTASGSLYPILARLEGAGWLTRGKEVIDPRAARRPARTHYRITGVAASAAASSSPS